MIQVELSTAEVAIEPGGTAQLTVTVHNRQAHDDHVGLEIEGIDVEWYALPVPTLNIPANETQSTRVLFKARRETGSAAGAYPFLVRCRGLESGETGVQQATLIVKPFSSLQVDINPKRAAATFLHHANIFEISISNYGNHDETLDLFATDPEDACAYEFETSRVTVKPGHTETVPLLVEPVTRPVLGASRLYGFAINARSTEDSYVSANAHAQLERRALLSTFTAAVLLAIFVLATAWAIWRPKPVRVNLFTANPMQVMAGDPVQLSWDIANSSNASVIIPGNIPVASPVNNVTVNPSETTTYTLIARGYGPDKRASVTVTVVPRPPAPRPRIAGFAATQKRIHQGDTVTLTWSVAGAKTIMLNPLGLEKDAELYRSQDVTPQATTTYILTAKGASGDVAVRQTTVEVVPPNVSVAQVTGFKARPASIVSGGKAVLTWSVDSAASIEIDNGVGGGLQAKGTFEVSPTQTTTYTLTATDSKGNQVTKQATVTVTEPPIAPPAGVGGTPGAPPPGGPTPGLTPGQ